MEIHPGTHNQEDQVNKQLQDKERSTLHLASHTDHRDLGVSLRSVFTDLYGSSWKEGPAPPSYHERDCQKLLKRIVPNSGGGDDAMM